MTDFQPRKLSRRLSFSFAMLALAPLLMWGFSAGGQHDSGLTSDPSEIESDIEMKRPISVTVPADAMSAILYADGQMIDTEWETLWRGMCNSDQAAINQPLLLDAAAMHESKFDIEPKNSDVIEPDGGVAGGFDVVFNLGGAAPPEAQQAFAIVEGYLESLFADPIVITVNVSFDALPLGVLGATGAKYTKTSWSNSRHGLRNGMDSTDGLLDHLPGGSTIPVRYNANNDTVTMENRLYWTRANFRATIGSTDGAAGDMIFNVDFNWDYDPADGVDGFSFQDVLVHEMGHVLGFASGADFRINDMEALDIFRFQRSGGGHDYNPDNKSEFKVRPRLVDFNKPNDQHICDIINHEYRMSDGNPYQCSHFREQSAMIGLMDPSISGGQTRYPDFFTFADLKMLDLIGYDW